MLVIFDCDGVIVDSEQLAAQVFSELLQSIGVSMTPKECHITFQGKTLAACYQWLETNKNITLPENFSQMLEEATDQRFSCDLKPVDDIERVLIWLQDNDIPFCVASNGSHKKIFNSLKTVGLFSYFNHRYSVEDVSEGKPKPDLFLHAASQMGCLPSQAVVIEDSSTGVQAATLAGMDVLRYCPSPSDPSPLEPKNLSDVETFQSMLWLCQYFETRAPWL